MMRACTVKAMHKPYATHKYIVALHAVLRILSMVGFGTAIAFSASCGFKPVAQQTKPIRVALSASSAKDYGLAQSLQNTLAASGLLVQIVDDAYANHNYNTSHNAIDDTIQHSTISNGKKYNPTHSDAQSADVHIVRLDYRRQNLVGIPTEVALSIVADVVFFDGSAEHFVITKRYQYNKVDVVANDKAQDLVRVWLQDELARQIGIKFDSIHQNSHAEYE